MDRVAGHGGADRPQHGASGGAERGDRQPWFDRRVDHRLRQEADPADRPLRNAKLRALHQWMQSHVHEYIGLYEAGSTSAGDPWVDGRTDRDIVILVDRWLDPAAVESLGAQLGAIGFNDTYLFNLVHRRAFLQTRSDQDISMKFRGVMLFGEDLLPQKHQPDREFAKRWADAGLQTMAAKFSVRVLNSQSWSVERLRDELYTDFKLMFMLLADRWYSETGQYPRRRIDVAAAYSSAVLDQVLNRMVRIDEADRESLVATAHSAIDLLRELNGKAG